jgi:hypothetical protein
MIVVGRQLVHLDFEAADIDTANKPAAYRKFLGRTTKMRAAHPTKNVKIALLKGKQTETDQSCSIF